MKSVKRGDIESGDEQVEWNCESHNMPHGEKTPVGKCSEPIRPQLSR